MSAPTDLVIDGEGWAASPMRSIERAPSPNHDARPDDEVPGLVVIHNISLPPGEFGGRAIDALFTNTLDFDAHPYFDGLRALRVSSHFLIRRDGAMVQFVACGQRAWHAGVSTFRGRERCNDFSIGIELEGDDFTAFDDVQYATLASLVEALARRYPVAAIVGHSDIAPLRKTDPGPYFDWARLRAAVRPDLREATGSMP